MTDADFIRALEDTSLDPAHFNHEGHMRAAWYYNCHFDEATAIDKCCVAINRYATSLGATDKFHRTITVALMKLVRRRMEAANLRTWDQLKAGCPELFTDAYGELLQYYDQQTLASAAARHRFVAPARPL